MNAERFLTPRLANHQPLTPVDLLWRAATAYPEKIAVIDGERRLTWRAFAQFVRRFASVLRSRGVHSGDVVAIIAPNCLEMLAAHYAVPMIGAVLNTINTRLDHESVAYILAHAEARLLLVHESCRPLAVPATTSMASPCPALGIGGNERELESLLADALELHEQAITDEWQPICLNYTSGTTGRPKGVVYHHRGAYLNALASTLTLGFSLHTRYLWVLPMFHCNGWAHTWSITAAGGTHVCLERVDAEHILRLLASEAITHLCCAPVVLYLLINHPSFAALSLAQRVTIGTGGAAPTATLIAALEGAGLQLLHLYGLTESFGPATFSPEQSGWVELSPEEKAVRLALQGVEHPLAGELRVVDESMQALPCDGTSVGEIVLRGNTVMAGYYRDEAATEQAFAGGWFHTGDLGVRHPNGHLELKDRAKDIIISGGENIASIEIESVLQVHPAVLIAAAVAMPHEKWGEVACAFVEVKAQATAPSERELIELCRSHLARFKVPQRIIFADIPKTATGKMQKYLLRQRARELVGDVDQKAPTDA
ncbi:MAG: AMP-binding protein [Steroidobacteraceae bacterium]